MDNLSSRPGDCRRSVWNAKRFGREETIKYEDEILAKLHQILHAARAVKQFVTSQTFESYCANELVRSGVERKFEIIGEALNRINRDDPDLLARIRQNRDIISFRNILVHGYDSLDPVVA